MTPLPITLEFVRVAESPAEATLAFASDWGTGTGSGDAALRDTGKALPWASVSGGNLNVAVVASTGLDFPTTNVLSVQTQWNGTGSSSKIIRRTGFGVPAVGESRFYRWYIRITVPDGISMGSPHPIQDGFDAGTSNWQFETRAGTTGTWTPSLQFNANVFPNDGWRALNALNRGQTYRFELRVTRTDTTTFTASMRVYNSAGVQVLGDSDFKNQSGLGSSSLADVPTVNFVDASYLDGFTMGTNGAFQGSTSGDHPLQFCYQGAAAISNEAWCGPYSAPEP